MCTEFTEHLGNEANKTLKRQMITHTTELPVLRAEEKLCLFENLLVLDGKVLSAILYGIVVSHIGKVQ